MVTKIMYDKGLRCKGICSLCGENKNNCYQYLNDIKDTNFDGNETEEENNVLSEQEIKTVKRLIRGIKADIQEIEEILGYE